MPGPTRKPVSRKGAERVARTLRAQALGASLNAQVESRARAALPRSGGQLEAGLAAAALGAGLWLVGLGWGSTAVGATLGYGLGLGLARAHRARRLRASWRDGLELAKQFDRLVAAWAPRLPEDALATLRELKRALAPLLPALSGPHGTLATDDAFFIRQAIVRYIPDAVNPFLALPADQVARQLPGHDATPTDLLLGQLALLGTRLREIGERQVLAQAGALARNKRFLERKLS